ncbi:Nucleotide-binding universal stress protein, UspA family [Polaribacter sp. KT25b]|uniref:universal stress protein n=1 Tax=Polaribacter sp. KT25b TaxID=1855336 RepID=UPI00087DBB89|nr:universal stress protein [Polaribacter sp. KT25b]SDS56488.1 Nucleotide-binding universal stress protein, UspA family [Polaribacter sp. KT25b]
MKEEKKYKILVLSDLKKSTQSVLKSTLSFAKIINADIHFFYIKKPTEIIKNDNQLSAKRAINKESFMIDKKIKNLLTSFSDDNNTSIKYSFSVGNVKNEIDNYLNKNNPDIVVLGKRKSKSFNILGDNITDFVLQNYKGSVIIASEENILEPHKKLSLGFLNDTKEDTNISLALDLKAKSKEPVKYFRVVKNSEIEKETHQNLEGKKIEYVFEENDTIAKNISNYLSKSNVNLLCLTKSKKANDTAFLKKIINDTNVSLLLTT